MSDIDPTVFSGFKDSLIKVISQSQDSSLSEHPAIVKDVDSDGTIWVRMFGMNEETPVTATTSTVDIDDVVQVTIADGRARITGNRTQPSAGVSYIDNSIVLMLDRSKLYVDEVAAGKGEFNELKANYAEFKTATIDDLTAANASITNLTADTAAISSLVADKASISQLTATNANIDALVSKLAGFNTAVADFLQAQHLEVKLADIDVATVTEGWIKDLMVQGSMITQSGTIYYLDSVHVNADSIDAGTIDVDRLIVTGADGEKYLVHVDSQGTPSYEKVEGNLVEDNTLAASKIIAHSITTDQITANNLSGTGGWINLSNGTFKYMNVHSETTDAANWSASSNGISWDGSSLEIKANEIELSSGASVSSIVSDLDITGEAVELLQTELVQTSNSLTVTVTDLSTLQDQVDQTNSDVSDLRQRVFITIPAYMTFEQTSGGAPLLSIGGGSSWTNFKMEISNTGLAIVNESTGINPAWFTKDSMYIQEAEVKGNLYFGDWVWTARDNKHMTLLKKR